MSCNAIDYFATLSRSPGPLQCKKLPSATTNSAEHPSEIWQDAITDICVIYFDDEDSIPGDDPDESGNVPFLNVKHAGQTWELVKYTVEGLPANCNSGDSYKEIAYLAVQRRRKSRRLDHICEITVLQKGDSVPDGYEVVTEPLISEIQPDGAIVPHRQVAFQRAPNDSFVFSHGHAMIDDICIVNLTEEEVAPDEYRTVDELIGGSARGSVGDKMILSYHHRPALGICNIPLESSTLDRYPKEDHDGLELPVAELPVFVYPHDLKLRYKPRVEFPMPAFFTFVFTDVTGRHLYTACLRFYEQLSKDLIAPVAAEMFGEDIDKVQWDDDMEFFCPKVICVVSQFPFYRAMGRYLKQLYSLSLSPSYCPLEHFISSVVAQVPLPVEGGRPLHVVLDAALISNTSRAMAPVCFELPDRSFFPPMDLDFAGPMRCLSVDNMLALFCLLLQESKVIFLCSSNALLTEVMETFRALLFPLAWTSCFITRLPDSLSGVLQAPGGFMIGLHMSDEHEQFDNDAEGREDSAGGRIGSKNYSVDNSWVQSLQSGTYIADLTDNKLYMYSGKRTEELTSGKINGIIKTLPSAPYRKLAAKIQSIGSKFRICPQQFEGVGLVQFDSAFDCVSIDELSLPSGRKWVDFPTYAVRDAFLTFMCDVLGDVTRYIRQPEEVTAANNFGKSFNELFMIDEYVQDADKSVKAILRCLMDTQMFPYLIQQRMEELHFPLVFFDRCVKTLKELGLSSLPNDRRDTYQNMAGKPNMVAFEADVEAPLFELVLRMEDKNVKFSLAKKPNIVSSGESAVNASDNIMLPSDENASTKFSSRKELGSHMDHQLDDLSRGCLIIPGPLLPEAEDEEDDLDEDERPSIVRFRYSSGWPTLDAASLEAVSEDLKKKGLSSLKETRLKMVVKTDPRCHLFMRPPRYRLSFHTSQSLLRAIPQKMSAESRGGIGVVLDIFAVSLTMLSLRATSGVHPIGSILQICSIIAQLDESKILSFVDVTTWRAILVACGAIKAHTFGHKAMCVLYDAMSHTTLPKDAIAYGLYCQSFSRKLAKTSAETESFSFLDPFYHLEQIGLSWYVQRSLKFDDAYSVASTPGLVGVSQSDQLTPTKKIHSGQLTPLSDGISPHSQSPNTPTSGGNIWRIFKGNKKQVDAVDTTAAAMVEELSNRAILASTEMSKSLKLELPPTLYGMRQPEPMMCGFVCKHVHNDESIPVDLQISESNLELRTKELLEFYERARRKEAAAAIAAQEARGKVDVTVTALHGLSGKNSSGVPIVTKNVYSRVWLSTDSSVRVKTQPGIKVLANVQNVDSSTSGPESISLFVSDVENSSLHFEVFGDFLRDNDDVCYAFDQSLGKGEISVASSTNSPMWVKLSGTSDLANALDLYVTFTYEKIVRNLDRQHSTDSINHDSEHSRSSAGGDADSGKSGGGEGGGKSWRDRFTNVFSNKHKNRSSSIGTSRSMSMTPPPPEASATPTPLSNKETVTSATPPVTTTAEINAQENTPAEDTEKTDDSTVIDDFREANTGKNDPLAVFDNTPEKKSRRWRKSLAMLTGEEPPGGEEDDGTAENSKTSSGLAGRIRRRLSGQDVKSSGDENDEKSEEAENDSPPTPISSPNSKKGKGMRAAFRRLSGEIPGASSGDASSPKAKRSLSGVFRRKAKQSTTSDDPLTDAVPDSDDDNTDADDDAGNDVVEDNSVKEETEVEEEDCVGGKSDDSTGEKDVGVNDSEEPFESGEADLAGDDDETPENDRASDAEQPKQRTESTERTSVDFHPLSFNGLSNEETENEDNDKLEGVSSEIDRMKLAVDTKIANDVEGSNEHGGDGSGESDSEADEVSDVCLDHLKQTRSKFMECVVTDRTVVGIYSESPCPDCGYLMFDDEMMGAWGGFCENSRSKDGSIVKAHVVLCPSCQSKIVPTLHVRQFAMKSLISEETSINWKLDVHYLSPYGLRFVIEHLLAEFGLSIVDAPWLLEHSPMAYWNLIWYCTRSNVPSGLFFDDNTGLSIGMNSPWLGPVVVNWREHSLLARVKKILSSGGSETSLELVDVFAGITAEDAEAVRVIMEEVDDSIRGLAHMLIGLSGISSLLNTFGGSQGRKIYMAVLLVMQLFKPSSLMQSSSDLPADLSKGVVFDRMLMEVVSIAFKPSDFANMGTTDTELIVASSGRSSQAIRMALGFLM